MATVARKKCVSALAASVFALTTLLMSWAPSSAAPITLQFADDFPATQLQNVFWKQLFDKIKQDSGGKLDIELYPGSVLYNGPNSAQAVSTGTLAMAAINNAAITTVVPAFNAFSLPDLAPTFPDVVKLSDPQYPLFKALAQACQAKNMVLLPVQMWESGRFPIIVASSTPFHSIRDLAGLKVRTLGGVTLNQTMEALGASPVAIPPADLPTAMQSGTVNAAIGSFDFFHAALVGLGHGAVDAGPLAVIGYFIVVNENVWKSIPVNLQNLMLADMRTANAQWTGTIMKKDDATENELKSQDHVWVYSITSQDQAYIKSKIGKVWSTFEAQNPALFNAVRATLKDAGF